MKGLLTFSLPLGRVAGIPVLVHWSWFLVAYFEIKKPPTMYQYGSPLWSVLEYVALFGLVLLHEFGHAFGLGDGTDANSVLYESPDALPTALGSGDVAAIQALYGTPAPAVNYHHSSDDGETSQHSAAAGVSQPTSWSGEDDGAEETEGQAQPVALTPSANYPTNQHYEITGQLGERGTASYTVQAPQTAPGSAVVLTASINTANANNLPVINVFDSAGNPVAANILVNTGGLYTIQAAGLTAGQTYTLSVSAPSSSGGWQGTYVLTADFGQPALTQTFASGTLTAATPQQVYALYVAYSQMFNFGLSAVAAGAPPGSSVQMTVYDATGALVYTQTSLVGPTVGVTGVLVEPGAYTVYFTLIAPSGAPDGGVTYQLAGTTISDRIGPGITNPTLQSMYAQAAAPWVYVYPNGVVSVVPYLWVLLAL